MLLRAALALLFAPPALAVPLRQVDWKNFTFGDGKMKLTQGEWERTDPEGWTESLSLVETLFGDLDGDGKEEAVVHTLYSGGGTGRFDEVVIYREGTEPEAIGQLPGGDRGDGGVGGLKLDGRRILLIRNGSLVGDGACCPSLEFEEAWTLTPRGPEQDRAATRVRTIGEPESTWEALRTEALAALKDDPNRAAELLRSALAHKPGDALTLQELGLALMKANSNLAVPVLYHALAVSDAKLKPAVLYNLGKAWLTGGQPARAVEVLEASLKLRPGNEPTQKALDEARSKLKSAGRPIAPKAAP